MHACDQSVRVTRHRSVRVIVHRAVVLFQVPSCLVEEVPDAAHQRQVIEREDERGVAELAARRAPDDVDERQGQQFVHVLSVVNEYEAARVLLHEVRQGILDQGRVRLQRFQISGRATEIHSDFHAE
jgi:hypothetical protein